MVVPEAHLTIIIRTTRAAGEMPVGLPQIVPAQISASGFLIDYHYVLAGTYTKHICHWSPRKKGQDQHIKKKKKKKSMAEKLQI